LITRRGSTESGDGTAEPPTDCSRCERLVAFRSEAAAREPTWFNGAVPSFGDRTARLLIVGLAPGLKGANRTGRPFTGDYAGELLYATLVEFGFARGAYRAEPDDGLRLVECMITNAVRCVPPANKPTADEIRNCRPFLVRRIGSLPRLSAILALGRVAHDQTLAALGAKASEFPFAHGRRHRIGDAVALYDSFHCSRYNTNTGRLTAEMFRSVFASIRADLGSS
jgi:uracil-DNA glycosylase family 4